MVKQIYLFIKREFYYNLNRVHDHSFSTQTSSVGGINSTGFVQIILRETIDRGMQNLYNSSTHTEFNHLTIKQFLHK